MHLRVKIKLLSPNKLLLLPVLVGLSLACLFTPAYSASKRYDLAYIWDSDFARVSDYMNSLKQVLPAKSAGKLIMVKKGDAYGIVYDRNAAAGAINSEMVSHSEMLGKAGLREPVPVEDQGYYRLYNVLYGVGPNLEVLKKRYHQLYRYFGPAVGRDLAVIRVARNNYALVYRRLGSRSEVRTVVRSHAKKLGRKGIKAGIVAERNQPVVYPEVNGGTAVAAKAAGKEQADGGKKISQVQTLAVASNNIPVLKDVYKRRPKIAVSAEDPAFERLVESFIRRLRRSGKISSSERTGWMVYDLKEGRMLVSINAEYLFQTASMVKPFVALAFFDQVSRGKRKYSSGIQAKMENMIQHSSNRSTNRIIKHVGGVKKVDKILSTRYGHLLRNTRVVETIPQNGRTYRNKAVPSDYVRFLRALWSDQLPHSKELKRLMALPGKDRIYYGTSIPAGTLIYNKTGSTAHLCGDMGILVPKAKDGSRHPYIMVGIIENNQRPRNYSKWISERGDVIRKVSELVYKEMKRRHQL